MGWMDGWMDGWMRNTCKILFRKPEGKLMWKDNIKMDLREIRWEGMDLIGLR
jgi:hypothetical protein